jgi:hypothetical protein
MIMLLVGCSGPAPLCGLDLRARPANPLAERLQDVPLRDALVRTEPA